MRCGANNACPDNLTCNPQGVCASTQSTMCNDLPTDDAGLDAIQPVLTTITLDVVEPDGTGQGGIDAIFSTPTGEMIKTARTPTSGRLVVDEIPVGSTVTIVRPSAAGFNATTHVDLWPDAHIVSRFAAGVGSPRFVTVNWQAPSSATPFYHVYSTCFGSNQSTTNLTLDIAITTACPRLDVIVIAKNASSVPLFSASVANVSSGPVTISPSMWNSIDTNEGIDATLTNLATSATLELSGYVTPAYAYSTTMFEATLPLDGTASLVFPTELGATAAVSRALTIGGKIVEQLYVERLPPGTTLFERDMGMRQFPWLTDGRLDLPTKTLSWSVTIGNNMMVTQPAIASVRLSFRRGGESHQWHIFSRGDRITANTVTGSFVLPELPGENAFEPVEGDTNIIGDITYFGVTPGIEDEVRGALESHEQRLDIFGIDGLTYVYRASTF